MSDSLLSRARFGTSGHTMPGHTGVYARVLLPYQRKDGGAQATILLLASSLHPGVRAKLQEAEARCRARPRARPAQFQGTSSIPSYYSGGQTQLQSIYSVPLLYPSSSDASASIAPRSASSGLAGRTAFTSSMIFTDEYG